LTAVAITGAGLVSALGDNPGALYVALCAGQSSLGPLDGEAAPPAELGVRLGCRTAGAVRGFDPRVELAEGNPRPLDRTAHLTVVAARRALADAGLAAAGAGSSPVLGLVLGTMFGSVRTIAEFDRRGMTAGPLYAKPMDFANSVINAAAGQAAIWHGLTGVNATLSGGPVAGAAALAFAADQVRAGRAAALLAGGADELAFESFLGFDRAGLLASENGGGGATPRPYDRRRSGFVPAEGAALLVLEDETAARARGARPIAWLLGHGAAFDAARGRDPERAAAAAERSMRLALADAGVEPEEIAVVGGSGSGSVAGDRAEARALTALLGPRLAELPVTAVKSMLGEALGASAAFQAVVLIESLSRGTAPGVAGLEEPEAGLALTAAHAAARPLGGGPSGRRIGLLHATGLDGHHASLVLASAER
jgi:3-oxoacyl-[acyl-carrier-protein] synthase II